MEYFSGTVVISCDEKGRYRIPSKYRAKFGDTTLFAFKNDNRYLSIISKDKADEIISKLGALVTVKDSKNSEHIRRLLANLEEIKEDNQGRFTLSAEIKSNLGLSKEVVFVGVSKKLEMWDKQKWDEYMEEVDAEQDLQDVLMEISF